MPYRISWKPSLAIVTFSGDIHGSEIIQATLAWQATEQFDDLHHVVYDCSSVQEIEPITNDVIEGLDAMTFGAKFSNRKITVAIVLPDNPSKSTIEDIVGRLESIYPIRIFNLVDDAYHWVMSTSRPYVELHTRPIM